MFYFIHGTRISSFGKILKDRYIYGSHYIDKKYVACLNADFKYVFTNVYDDELPLTAKESIGWGQIAFIIDPVILNYKSAWYNDGLGGCIDKDSIYMNDNVEYVLSEIRKNYTFPFLLTQEVLFNRRISMRYVIGIVYGEESNKELVERYLKKYGYDYLPIYPRLPKGDIAFSY
jgi:hypothetical protein